MKKFIYIVIGLLILSSCKKKTVCEEPKLDCSGVRCFAHLTIFEFRLVNHVSGNDVLFGANPSYTESDIRLFADAAKTIPISYSIDRNRKILQTNFATRQMFLEIKGLDTYVLDAEYRTNDCCSSRVKSISIDNKLICSCCTDVINLPVR